jgi:uncharacterized protein
MTTVQHLASHRWRTPSRSFGVTTLDGVRIVGSRLGDPGPDLPAIVLGHGLMGWHRKPRFAGLAEKLAERFTVYAFDFRGHGDSGGVSDFGVGEINDVEAVVDLARRIGHERVVTCGASMGAISVVRHGGLIGGVDGVVAISCLAYWDWHEAADPRTAKNMQARIGTPAGRLALRAWGARLPDDWKAAQSPEEVVGMISPAPLILIHGRDDRLFPPDHAMRLYEAAKEPKRLFMADGFGHAEGGFSPGFAAFLSDLVAEEMEVDWSA